jgi:hypothetical protein
MRQRVKATTRQQELVVGIADFLVEWIEEDEGAEQTSNVPFDESITEIESYGAAFSDSGNSLVINAIRHLIYHVNPWNRDAVPDILTQCGFTEDEAAGYFKKWASGDW